MHFVMMLPSTCETRIKMSKSYNVPVWRLRQSACRTVAIETSMKSSVQTLLGFSKRQHNFQFVTSMQKCVCIYDIYN